MGVTTDIRMVVPAPIRTREMSTEDERVQMIAELEAMEAERGLNRRQRRTLSKLRRLGDR